MSNRSMGNLTLNVIANTGSFEEGATRTERALDKMNKAVQRQKNEFASLIDKIDPVVAELNKLDKMQAQLEKHRTAGLIDDTAYTNYTRQLQAMQREVVETNSAFAVQQREFAKLINQIDPTVSKLAELDKMQEQLQAGFKAGLVDEQEFNRLNNVLNHSRSALTGVNEQMGKNSISSKQMAAAMRGLPAQFTDIVVSLQGGMNPLTVLLQQGGQIKDMFGGTANAVRALSSYVIGLVNPITVFGAGLAVVTLAYYQGSIEADKFRQALLFTGNVTGETTDGLAEMAMRIEQVSGTQRQASAAIAEAAATGRFTSEQLELVGRAAVLMDNTVGKATADTIKEFEQLAKDPAKAVAELNEKYNFLTADIYEQITALEKQGRTQEAATLAIKSYADATEQRTTEVLNNLGLIEQAWKGIKEGATSAWDAVLDVGRTDTLQAQVDDAKRKLEALQMAEMGADPTGRRSQYALAAPDNSAAIAAQKEVVQQLETQLWMSELLADGDRLRAELNKKSISAQQAINKLLDEAKSTDEKRADAVKKYLADIDAIRAANPSSELVSEKAVAKGLAAINEKYKSNKKTTDSAAQAMLLQLAQQEAALREQLGTNEKIGAAVQALAKFEQQLADLKDKKTLTAQQKSLLAEQEAIRAQLQKNIALEKEIKLQQEIARLSAFQKNLESETQQEREKYGDMLQYFGMGERARDRLSQRTGIERDVQRGKDRATSDFATGSISEEEYSQQIEMLDTQLKTRLELLADYYASEEELRGDWSNGWEEAWANWSDQVNDIAGQMETVFSGAFGNLEDALYDFVTTGNFSLSEMIRGMAEETLRMMIRIGAQKLINFALEKTIGASAAAGFVGQITGESQAMAKMAELNAFASTAAIPIIGPAMAPGAALAAAAVAEPLSVAAIAGATASLAGMAHSGLDYIPKEGTWLLDKGERVLSPRQNQDLTDFLSTTPNRGQNGRDVAITVPLTINGNPDDKTLRLIQNAARDGAAMAYQKITGDLASGRGDVSKAVQGGFAVQRRMR